MPGDAKGGGTQTLKADVRFLVCADICVPEEAKLNALPAEKLKELRDNGALSQIYAHLISLLGWDRLIVKAMLRPRTPVAANG